MLSAPCGKKNKPQTLRHQGSQRNQNMLLLIELLHHESYIEFMLT